MINYEDGIWIVEQYDAGNTITFEFVNDNKPVGVKSGSPAAGGIDYFSSWGPTLDSRMKPEISAPGESATFLLTLSVSDIYQVATFSRHGLPVMGAGPHFPERVWLVHMYVSYNLLPTNMLIMECRLLESLHFSLHHVEAVRPLDQEELY